MQGSQNCMKKVMDKLPTTSSSTQCNCSVNNHYISLLSNKVKKEKKGGETLDLCGEDTVFCLQSPKPSIPNMLVWYRIRQGTLTFRSYIRCSLSKATYSNSYIHSFIHWWWWLPCKVPTRTSGAVWGSVSWPRTLRHADQGNPTRDLPITRCWLHPWATAAPLSRTIVLMPQMRHSPNSKTAY